MSVHRRRPSGSSAMMRRGRTFVSVVGSALLVAGLLSTPMGAIAATPSPDPTSSEAVAPDQTAPDPTTAPEPTPEASVTAEPSPEPEQSASAAPEPTPSPEAPPTSSVPAPSPAPEPTPTPAPDPEPHAASDPPAPRALRSAGIGILAAGIPNAPTPVWSETFEQGLGTTTPSALTAYASGRFTTSTGWSTGTNCTGVLVNYTAAYPNASFCPTQLGTSSLTARDVRRAADVLGQVSNGTVGSTNAATPVNGSTTTPAGGTQANHALTNNPTAVIAAGNTTIAQTAAGIAVSAPAPRYYAMRFDAVGFQCGVTNASLSASLFTGATTLLAGFPTPIVPCTTTGNVFYTSPALATIGGLDPAWGASVRAGSFAGTGVALLTPAQISSAQVRLTNTTTGLQSGFGVDNVRVLDVSPALDMDFDPSPAVSTLPTTLTYTVTNTSDLYAKSDWGFTTTLPTGLVVAATPSVGGSCANAAGTAYAVTATAGSSTIGVVGGDLTAGMTSCTIQVNVVAAIPGTYTSGTVAPVGVIPSAAESVTVQQASTLTLRKNVTQRGSATDQFALSVRQGTATLDTATTAGTATGIQPQQVSALTVTPGSTYTIYETITSGAGLNYTSSYECTRDATVIAVGSSPTGQIAMPADLGAQVVCTFTNTYQAQQRLSCTTNQFYAVTPAGALIQEDIVTGSSTTVGTWNVGSNANSLGVGPNGAFAYAVQRSSDAVNVTSMLKWTPTSGFQTIAGSAYTTVNGSGTAITGSIVAGAVDLSGNRFVFGKFSGTSFHLWSYTETNPVATRYQYLGNFPTTGSPNGNGDLAFDARGNLYVVGAATVSGASSAVIFTVPAESIATASGGVLPVSSTIPRGLSGTDATPVFSNANGLAFSPRGTAYLSDSALIYEFDPTTWTRTTSSARAVGDHTDLASCSSPSTVTVLKNAVGRAAAADQFTLTLNTGATAIATATTTGVATGRQAAQIGPIPVPVGTALTYTEAMAAGSSSLITAYTTIGECWADGVRLSTTTSPTGGAVTVPDRLGVNVVCTYFNSPRPASTVTLTKQVLNPATGTTAPAAGWSVGTAATATVGTATVLPSESPRQFTNASGQAVWSVLYGSTASRATLTISEEMQSGFIFSSASCTVNGVATPITFTTANNVASGTIANTQSASTIACTIVNRPVAVLTLVKQVSLGAALPTDWTLTAAGPVGSLIGPTGRTGTAATSAVNVTPGVAYRLSEAGGTLSYTQVGNWVCLTSGGTPVTVTTAGDVTLAQGSNVTCTVTNATARITFVKEVQGAQAGFQPANWTLTATPATFAGGPLPTPSVPGAVYSPGNNAASTFDVRPSHTYTLSEAPTTPGSRLAYRTLRLERLDGSTWTTVSSDVITSPAAGQTATYRFVNASVQPTTLPLTGGLSADAFFIAGGGLLAALLTVAVLSRWRRRRPM